MDWTGQGLVGGREGGQDRTGLIRWKGGWTRQGLVGTESEN